MNKREEMRRQQQQLNEENPFHFGCCIGEMVIMSEEIMTIPVSERKKDDVSEMKGGERNKQAQSYVFCILKQC